MATHAQNIENLRTATYGEQVRGSMIELFEEDYDLCKNGVWVGTDITSASDPTTGYTDGTLYINSDSWRLFKLEGAAWRDCGTIKGAKGESVVGVHDNGDGTFYLVLSDGSHTSNIATVQGLQGPQGPQGIQGLTGAEGRSVTSMTMSGTGKQHQIIATYSDGVSQTVGVVQDGADGSGTGDMSKATYDVNDHGYVDAAAAITDGVNLMPYSTIAAKADAATTLAGYGIEDAYTDDETDAAISDAISSATTNLYSTSDAIATTVSSVDYIPLYKANGFKRKIDLEDFSDGIKDAIKYDYGDLIIRYLDNIVPAGTQIRIPATGTDSRITGNSRTMIIPICQDSHPIKYREMAVDNGFVTIIAGESVVGGIGIWIKRNPYE